MRNIALALGAFGLSACSGTGTIPPLVPSQPPTASPRPSTPAPDAGFRAPQVQRDAGFSGVIGVTAPALLQKFGKARIDLAEGDARKLQFVGQSCVLDIFLYPLGRGQPPVATHVEARLRNGGAPIDPGRCIEELSAS